MEKDQDYSTNSCESFAWWDQNTLCLRTWQRCLLEGWTRFSERLPRMGTMRNGKLYQRKAWARRTDATECLLSDTWPTPSAQEPGIKTTRLVDKNGNQPTHSNQRLYDKETGRLCQKGLTQAVQIAALWPTPATSNAKGASKKRYAGSPEYRGNLDEAVRTSETSGQLNPQWVEWLMGFPDGWTDLDA